MIPVIFVDMSTMRLSAKMDRTDGGTPWGFRMTGGKDFGAPLVVQRVSHGVYEVTSFVSLC